MIDRGILLTVSSDGSDSLDEQVCASIPLDRATLECHKDRTRYFHKAKKVPLDLDETYECQRLLPWYGAGSSQKYVDQADREELEQFSSHAGSSEGEPSAESRLAALDNLKSIKIRWLVVPVLEPPGKGNLRPECDPLLMSRSGGDCTRVDLALDLRCRAQRGRTANSGNHIR